MTSRKRKRKHARAVVLSLLMVVSVVAGSLALAGAASGTPGGMVGVPSENIESDLPPKTPMGQAAQEIKDQGVLTDKHADTLEVVVTNPGRAKKYTDGAVFGDGPIAIVVRDDVHDEGRQVAIPKDVLKDVLGHVPEMAYGTHDDGTQWTAPTTVKDEYVVVDVTHFSTNTITWSGMFTIEADPATDGSQWNYNHSGTSISNYQINVTGDTRSEWDNVSATAGNAQTVDLSVAGNLAPTGPSGANEPMVEFEGYEKTSQKSASKSNMGDTDQLSVSPSGNVDPTNEDLTIFWDGNDDQLKAWDTDVEGGHTESYSNPPVSTAEVAVYVGSYYTELNPYPAYIYIDGSKVATLDIDRGGWYNKSISYTTTGETVDVKINATQQTGVDDVVLKGATNSNSISVSADGGGQTVSTTLDGEGQVSKAIDITTSSTALTLSSDYGGVDLSLNYDDNTVSEDPAVDIDGDGTDEASYSGILNEGSTATYELASLGTSDDTTTVSTTNGDVTLRFQFQERTQTVDPTVEVNGNTTSYTGALADGETVSLTTDSTWVRDGENTVNISVTPNANSDWPAPAADLYYYHEGDDESQVDYTAGKWVEEYNVSKTFANNEANASLTIPFDGAVLSISNIEMSVNGGSWSTVSNYGLSDTTLTAYLGSVSSGDKVRVRTSGHKVSATNGAVQVTDPTLLGADLDTKVDITDYTGTGDPVKIGVGGTPDGANVHYVYDTSWTADEYSRFDGDGDQSVVLPNAGASDTFRISTIPLEVSLQTGDVDVRVPDPKSTEPEFEVLPGSGEGDTVEYTYLNAQDGEDYLLYSKSNGVVRDSGTASSPLTLEDDDSDETLIFQLDDSNTSSTDSVSGPVTGSDTGIIPSSGSSFLLYGVIGLAALVALYLISRRFGAAEPPSSSTEQAAESGGAVRRSVGTVRRSLEWGGRQLEKFATYTRTHPYVAAVLGAAVVGWLFISGLIALPEGGDILLLTAGVPIVAWIAIRRWGGQSLIVWAGVTGVALIIGLNALGTDIFGQLTSSEAFPIFIIGTLGLAYYALQTYQTEASTPDEQTNVTFEVNDDGSQ